MCRNPGAERAAIVPSAGGVPRTDIFRSPNQEIAWVRGRSAAAEIVRHQNRRGIMDRRTFLKSTAQVAALAAARGVATPAISQRVGAGTVRLDPHADLANFDPIWTPA